MRELYKQGKNIAANAHSHASKRFNAGATHPKNPPNAATFSKAGPYKTSATTATKGKKKKRITSAATPQSRLVASGAAPPTPVDVQASSSTSSNLSLQASSAYLDFTLNPGIVARVFTSVFDVFFSAPPNSSYPLCAGHLCTSPASSDIYEVLTIAHTPPPSANSLPETLAVPAQPQVTVSTLVKENTEKGLQMASHFAAAVDTAAETLLTDLSASTFQMLSHGDRVDVVQRSETLSRLSEGTREFVEEVTPLEVVDMNGEANDKRQERTVDEEMMDEFEVIHHEFDVDVEEMEDGWSRIV
ncbi:hypothetical protein BC830DRAFT_1162983 [Chytriomyces sp. MP71]|nr:hypothetical protein BC830DRAFT_964501 [Chytriomyces sp. MP71]KAI8622364.1 hypothetical protein BC830DRAFT_1162983 [Chytriomyces sp. MP71]